MIRTPLSLLVAATLLFSAAGGASAKNNARLEVQAKSGVTAEQVRKATSRVTVGTIRDLDGKDIAIQCKGKDDCVAVLESRSVAVDVQFELDAQGAITTLQVDRSTIKGNFHKGPFVAGSTVRAWPLDDGGTAIGAPSVTTTEDDLGSYTLSTWTAGCLLVEGRGLCYDEAAGETGDAPITLRAVVVDTAAPAHVNAFTHLAAPRALRLAADGLDLDEAVGRADAELARALELERAVPGTELRLDGELFEISTVLTAVAHGDEARLQALLDELAADLADDGRLDPAHVELLRQTRGEIDLEAARDAYEARYRR